MDGRQFDALLRSAMGSAESRRGLLRIVGVGATALGLGLGVSQDQDGAIARDKRKKRQRRRQRRKRIERRKVQVCHDETLIKVRRKAAESHLQHGDRFGSCDIAPGVDDSACPNGGTAPCNNNFISCGAGCVCLITTSGATFCAGGVECPAGFQCESDNNCINRFGSGWACVPVLGDCFPGCKTTACVQQCNA